MYTELFQSITSNYGKDFTFDVKLKLMGTQALEGAKIAIKELDLPLSPEEFLQASHERKHIFADCQIMPGTMEI